MVTAPTLPLAIKSCHLAFVTPGLIIPIAFRFTNLVTAISTVISDLQGSEITELFKDAATPFTNLFLSVMIKGISFQGGEILNDTSTLTR